MVQFRSPNRPRPRDYLSRREQWRLLLLVMSLGLVVIAMGVVRRPESAAWLGWLLTGGQVSQQPAGPDAAPNVPSAEPGQTTVRIAANGAPADALRYFPGVDPALLTTIGDNTYFRSSEQDAWFNLLSVLQKTPSAELQAASIGDVGYAQLIEQPHVYRGRIVSVRGTVHQVTVQHPAENQIGLELYYRLVIRPADGGVWPIFAYVLDLPAGMRPGEDPAADVTVTGFFFKNLSYQWQDGLGIAPVMLARDVTGSLPLPTGEGRGEGDSKARQPSRFPTNEPGPPHLATASLRPEGEGIQELAKVLSLAGWDWERLAAFGDDTLLADDQRQSLAELVWRLRTFGAASLAEWTRNDVATESLLAEPAEYRGELISLVGQVRGVTRHALSTEDAQRLEMPAYFECEVALEGGAMATVIAARVPKAWLDMSDPDEPASASALFVKRLPPGDGVGRLLFVSDAIAWHPTVPREPLVSSGESVLGTLGMDVGLLDDVRNHRPILASEREAFYGMLWAVGRIGANQLIRFAQDNLAVVRQQWEREAERLSAWPDAASPDSQQSDTSQRLMLAEEVLRRAADGLYSVAPLFNDADHQIGQLVVFDGVARRAVRVEVGTSPDGSPSDALRRFGINHYFELEVFTDDSQDYPLVFCVRELPAGFPTGGAIHEPVRVAGFFFKSWLYHTHKPGGGESAGVPQYAPLLVGRAPVRLQPAAAGGRWPELTIAGLFVLALAGVWWLAWWYSRGDQRFARTVLAQRYRLPEGQSLNDLDEPNEVADAPD